MNGGERMTVFVVSWGRPIYLWNCLDSLYRTIAGNARVILLDNRHPDPEVGHVIDAFRRRGLLDEVVRFDTNSVANIANYYSEKLADCHPLHVWIESDVVIERTGHNWLETMQRLMTKNPHLAALGSVVDPTDFVSEQEALALTFNNMDRAVGIAKLRSPERILLAAESPPWLDDEIVIVGPDGPLGNPPGRLLMLRTSVMEAIGPQLDSELPAKCKALGLDVAITPLVRHRHLSLQNIFDYPDYYTASQYSEFTEGLRNYGRTRSVN